ncbi:MULTISPECIES: hypothetical protein [unclassified Streptomyces]|uniref:hypothetical protein n=1 Tax=Streptomyces sp. NRRL F-4428 TaxID=1609137 RepID=UPI0005ED07C1|nr:hypothetical protein [Streptomyces sp. NRRL F-4428]
MSLHDDLTAVRRNLDELTRKVERLEQRAARHRPAPDAPDPSRMVTVPDTPYDSSLWTDSDDEGLGGCPADQAGPTTPRAAP